MDIPERPPPLEFITLTERPATQKNDFSYVVRSHAMQAVIHERRNPKSKKAGSASSLTPEGEVKTSKELSGKFKLNTWTKKKRRRKNTPAQETEEQLSGNVSSDTANFAQVSEHIEDKYRQNAKIRSLRQVSRTHYGLMVNCQYPPRAAVHNNCFIIVCKSGSFCRIHLTIIPQIIQALSQTHSLSTMMILGNLLARQTQHSCMQPYVSWLNMKILSAGRKTHRKIYFIKEK